VLRLPGSVESLTLRPSVETFREPSWSGLDLPFDIWIEEGPFGLNEALATVAFYETWTLKMRDIANIPNLVGPLHGNLFWRDCFEWISPSYPINLCIYSKRQTEFLQVYPIQ